MHNYTLTGSPAVTLTHVTLRWNFNDLLPFLRNKFKFLQLATHQNSVITVAFANCVFFLFSDYRGYKDRKDVSKIKSMAAKMETKTIYFLQQVRILVKKVFENTSFCKKDLQNWRINVCFCLYIVWATLYIVNVLCY